jgi:hypothetical protein
MNRFLRTLIDWLRSPRFATYRPAPRLGTRRVERRLTRRLNWQMADSAL